MLFSRLPLSLLTLIFAFAVDSTTAKGDNGNNQVKYVDIFAVDYPIVAYIHDSHHAQTTYHIACSSDTDTSSCPFAQPYTLIQGPSTLSFEFTTPLPTTTSAPALTQSFTLACDLESTTSMACSATGLADADTPVTTSQTFFYTGTAAQAFFKEVQVVTNRQDLLTHTPGESSAKPTITEASGPKFTDGGLFFEGKQAVTTSLEVDMVFAVAETSTSASLPTATSKTSGAGRNRAGWGLF